MTFSFKKIKKAIFPVAGLGTRFLPITKTIPKEMLPIGNKPIIQYTLEEAVKAGIEEFIFITNAKKDTIVNFFDKTTEVASNPLIPDNSSIITVRQHSPLGLGDAILCARKIIGDEPFAVLLPDEIFIDEVKGSFLSCMISSYYNIGNPKANMLGVSYINKEETNNYGIIGTSTINNNSKIIKVNRMLEKPEPKNAPSNIAIVGRYILQPEIFKFLEKRNKGHNNEIQLTDSMSSLLDIQDFYGHLFKGNRFDAGSYEGFLSANIAFAIKEKSISLKTKDLIINILNKM